MSEESSAGGDLSWRVHKANVRICRRVGSGLLASPKIRLPAEGPDERVLDDWRTGFQPVSFWKK